MGKDGAEDDNRVYIYEVRPDRCEFWRAFALQNSLSLVVAVQIVVIQFYYKIHPTHRQTSQIQQTPLS